jgi:hypothetical protein
VIQTPQAAFELPTQHLAFPDAVPAVSARGRDRLSASASFVPLEQGIYSLTVGETASSCSDDEYPGFRVPLVQIAAPPEADGRRVEIIGNGQHETWLGREGGMIILRSPPGGAQVLVTLYGAPGQPVAVPYTEIQRLDRPRSNGATRRLAEPAAAPEEIRTEIVLHIERVGDQRFAGHSWAGNRGKRLRVEAFSIRPLEALAARDIEFMALGPKRRQTPWVSDAKLCGTRGQGMPLTGFAMRLAPPARDRFDIVYEGAFFESGVVGPHRNGEICIPPVSDDPLEAIKVRLTRRPAGRGHGPG